jgi:hypothetical protein
MVGNVKNKISNDMEKELDTILNEFDKGNMCLNTLKAKLLLLFGVSNQREQLILFFNWYQNDPKELSNNETIVDAYLDEITCRGMVSATLITKN